MKEGLETSFQSVLNIEHPSLVHKKAYFNSHKDTKKTKLFTCWIFTPDSDCLLFFRVTPLKYHLQCVWVVKKMRRGRNGMGVMTEKNIFSLCFRSQRQTLSSFKIWIVSSALHFLSSALPPVYGGETDRENHDNIKCPTQRVLEEPPL